MVIFLTSMPSPGTITLSLHDALPISSRSRNGMPLRRGTYFLAVRESNADAAPSWSSLHVARTEKGLALRTFAGGEPRSEEHTSELQSRLHLVCRLLLEKKNIKSAESA